MVELGGPAKGVEPVQRRHQIIGRPLEKTERGLERPNLVFKDEPRMSPKDLDGVGHEQAPKGFKGGIIDRDGALSRGDPILLCLLLPLLKLVIEAQRFESLPGHPCPLQQRIYPCATHK